MCSRTDEKRSASDSRCNDKRSTQITSHRSPKRVRTFGLPKHQRLKGKQAIKALFKKGKRFHRKNLTIIYLFAEEPKVGFFASKEIGGAVKRNRIRRILREAYRMKKDFFHAYHAILYAHGPITLKEAQSTLIQFGKVQ
jgi:ribonuclease P protein component